MPDYDGTGPKGSGPFTGGGRGYCVLQLPSPGSGGVATGYAGIQGKPVQVAYAPVSQVSAPSYASSPLPSYRWDSFRGGWHHGGRRGRGRLQRRLLQVENPAP